MATLRLACLSVFLFLVLTVVGIFAAEEELAASVSSNGFESELITENSYRNQANEDLKTIRVTHSAQFQTLRSLILSGRCKHFYIDLGTNIGIQQRKLYEPEYFPDSPTLPYFDRIFGNERNDENKTRTDVCSVGFEPGPIHVQRLIQLQDAYQKAGYPMVVFTSAAVWTEDGTMTFYEDRFSPEFRNQWGSSLLKVHDSMMIPHEVLTIDIVRFLREIFLLWDKYQVSALSGAAASQQLSAEQTQEAEAGKYYFDPNKSQVLLKMDIEGAEYTVFPQLVGHGLLCSINTIFVEFHRHYVSTEDHDNLMNFLQYFAMKIKNCQMQILELDDEMYGAGVDDRPLPLPNTEIA
jgi:hypothetical protein